MSVGVAMDSSRAACAFVIQVLRMVSRAKTQTLASPSYFRQAPIGQVIFRGKSFVAGQSGTRLTAIASREHL